MISSPRQHLLRQWIVLCAGLLLCTDLVRAAISHDAASDWYSLQSAHFIIHYPQGSADLAQRLANTAEAVHRTLTARLPWPPQDRTQLVLSDESDLPNGAATPLPRNAIQVFLRPPETGQLADYTDWLTLLLTHEYTHTLHLNKAAGIPLHLRQLFGRTPLLFPNLFQPRWIIEGLATWMETNAEQGIGRGQATAFATLMQLELQGGFKSLQHLNMVPESWPGASSIYLYGVYFMQFLEQRYGRPRITAWLQNYSDNALPFFVNSTAQESLGMTLTELWPRFERWLRQRFPDTLHIPSEGPHTGKRLDRQAITTSPAIALPDGGVLFVENDGRRKPRLLRWQAGKRHVLTPVNPAATLDWDPRYGLLISQPERCHEANRYHDLYVIRDLDHPQLKRLTHCGRYRHAVWRSDGDILAVQSQRERDRLVRLSPQGEPIQVVWSGAAWEVIAGLDLAPGNDQEAVLAIKPAAGFWDIYRLNLAQGTREALTRDAAIDSEPQYRADGKGIFFVSDAGGHFQLWQLDSQHTTRQLLLPYNTVTAARQGNHGNWLLNSLTTTGIALFQLPGMQAQPPMPVAIPHIAPPVHTAAPVVSSQTLGAYQPWNSLKPTAWLPYWINAPEQRELGLSLDGSDALQRHQYALLLAKDLLHSGLTGSLDYLYDRYRPILKLHAERWRDISSSGLHRILHQRSQAELILPRYRWQQRQQWHLGLIHQHDQREQPLPETSRNDNRIGLAWRYASTVRPSLALGPTDGWEAQLVQEHSLGAASFYRGRVQRLVLRRRQAVGQQLLLLRGVLGQADVGQRAFQLGGSLSAFRPSQALAPILNDTPFDRQDYSLRGYNRSQHLRGHHMALFSAEWQWPIWRGARGWMAPPIGLRQLSGTLFTEAGRAENSRPWQAAVGVELHARTVLFYALPLRLRLGLAQGLSQHGRSQLYLSLGQAF